MGEYSVDSLDCSKCREQTTMLSPYHTSQATMQIRSTSFSEGKKLNLNVSDFILYLRRNAKVLLAFNSQWLQNGKGLLSHKLRSPFTMQLTAHLSWERLSSAFDAGIRIRPNVEDLKTMPEFEERWKTYFANSPDKPIMILGSYASQVFLPS